MSTQIPAITDKLGDKTIRLFESGSILLYLVDRYDKDHKLSYPHGTEEYYETNNWVRHLKLHTKTVNASLFDD